MKIGEIYKEESVQLTPVHAQNVITMVNSGAFDIENGSITLHFNNGVIREVVKNEKIYKK